MTGLGLAVAGWAAFALAAGMAIRSWHVASVRGQAVARACHEVRGPLAAVRLGLEAGLAASPGPRLQAIEIELARATMALDDLQGVRRAPVKKPVPMPLDVRAWLNDAVEAWCPVARACGMEMRLRWQGPRAVVWGNQARLAQVTGNLIANAIDHGQGFVELAGRVEAARVVVEVSDGGPGLPPAVSRWLRTGERPGRRPRVTGGRGELRGHGLIIARTVARAHGGELSAGDGQPGARLVLTLPLARS